MNTGKRIEPILNNEYLNQTKEIAGITLDRPTQKVAINVCLDNAFLEGVKVGLEEAKKIYKETTNDIYDVIPPVDPN